MATLKRILRQGQTWRTINFVKSLTSYSSPSPIQHFQRRFYNQPPKYNMHPETSEELCSETVSRFRVLFSILPAVLAGVLGVGLQQISHADADMADSKVPLPSESASSYSDLEKIVKQERLRLEELLKSRAMFYGSYPRFTVAMKGQKVTIKFQIPPTCEAAHLIVDLVSRLGLKVDERGGGSDMVLRAWDSPVAWQITLKRPDSQKKVGGDMEVSNDKDEHDGDLCILIFQSLITSDNAEIEFIKQGSFSQEELDALVFALKIAGGRMGAGRALERRTRGPENKPNTERIPSTEKSVAALEAMGVRVFGLNGSHAVLDNKISWDNIAGYDQQKREMEDIILLALHSPEIYDDIARGTRCKFESNRPRAVLFEGPPGTGKTSCARVIASQAGIPLLYVPLEVVMSKYYGESERLLGNVFSLANEFPNGAIIFLDEVDSFAVSRCNEMHEATRRILSVLLRQIDGFEQEKRVVVIAATNRKQDLDPALISRFDSMITFGLPDQQNRQKIVAQYAKHLKESELIEFSAVTEEMSGRDIRDICQQAERHWASKIIRGQAPNNAEQVHLPPLQEYIESALNRQEALRSISNQKNQSCNPPMKRSPLDFQ